LANLLGVPVVAVFGSTNPVWFGPRGLHDRVVIRPEFWCRPCFDYCIFDEPHCLRTITPGEVIREAAELMRDIKIDSIQELGGSAELAVRHARGRTLCDP
jgi:ADP-heptose:LPS heptosyltransferase